MGANPNRVSLLVSASGFTSVIVSAMPGSGFNGSWYGLATQNATPLTYRDYGPLIKEAVFCHHISGSPVTVIVTEVFRISGC
jgi:hypothetical protein